MNSPASVFKKCSCDTVWPSRKDLLDDPAIEISGYMANFEELELGLLLFLHKKKGCFTTISLYADQMRDLHKGPVFKKRLYGTKQCPGYCLRENDFQRCPAQCECAWVREVIHTLKLRKKIKQ